MKDQVVFDIETAGVGKGKVILSLAALRFDLEDRSGTEEFMKLVISHTNFIMGAPLTYASDPDVTKADLILIKFPLLDSLRLGFQTDESTLNWWGKQPESNLRSNIALTPIGGIESCLSYLSKWIMESSKPCGREGIAAWANSPRFDFEMLKGYYDVLKIPFPLDFRRERDVRTIRAFFALPGTDVVELGLLPHNPIHDCFAQALDIQKAWAMATI